MPPAGPPPLRAELVAEVQQTRAENYFASVEMLHRLLAEDVPSGAQLTSQQAVELANTPELGGSGFVNTPAGLAKALDAGTAK